MSLHLKVVFITICSLTESSAIVFSSLDYRNLIMSGALDLNVIECSLLSKTFCPNPYILYHLYTKQTKSMRHGVALNINNPLTLYQGGFSKQHETAIIVHGFNGSATDKHLQYLKDAYISRDFNVITVDWRPLTRYPCYLHSLINTRLTAQCTAQVYSFITHYGAPREKITCIGHSLGAHICGMVSNHLSKKQYRIIGLDPARPLIERKKGHVFRLSKDDASVIQVLHTNAGFLGQEDNTGHLNYCINGGRTQPYCKGTPIRRSRCSHFLAICYLANAMFKHKKFLGVQCADGCVNLSGPKRLPVTGNNPFGAAAAIKEYYLGNDAPDNAEGCFCIDVPFAKHCPFTRVYSFITHYGAPREKITCIGHSLGAHICGMVSNHLSKKQYRIIGLDPARPLIERKKGHVFRLSKDDASVIQVLHTNAGFLGQEDNTGHLNYCINGGRTQPYCKGTPIRRSRCSHFLAICYLANAMFKHKKFLGVQCADGCVNLSGPKRLPVTGNNPFGAAAAIKEYYLGNDAPDNAEGCFCIDVPFAKHCPFTRVT